MKRLRQFGLGAPRPASDNNNHCYCNNNEQSRAQIRGVSCSAPAPLPRRTGSIIINCAPSLGLATQLAEPGPAHLFADRRRARPRLEVGQSSSRWSGRAKSNKWPAAGWKRPTGGWIGPRIRRLASGASFVSISQLLAGHRRQGRPNRWLEVAAREGSEAKRAPPSIKRPVASH